MTNALACFSPFHLLLRCDIAHALKLVLHTSLCSFFSVRTPRPHLLQPSLTSIPSQLAALLYVLVPMPFLFFGQGSDSGYYGSSSPSGWVDAGKFLTGFSAVGILAIPAILHHSQIITTGALVMELAAAALLGSAVLAYDYLSSRSDSYY